MVGQVVKATAVSSVIGRCAAVEYSVVGKEEDADGVVVWEVKKCVVFLFVVRCFPVKVTIQDDRVNLSGVSVTWLLTG